MDRPHPEARVNCSIHKDTALRCPKCSGAEGGSSQSAKKIAAALDNLKRAQKQRKAKP